MNLRVPATVNLGHGYRELGTMIQKSQRQHRAVFAATGILGLVVCVSLAHAVTTNAPASGSFESFRIISQRNVFDAGRNPRHAGRDETAPPAKVEALTLVGTMSYSHGDVAFFDSPSAELKKPVRVGDIIGGCRVERISPDSVLLNISGGVLEVPVQGQLRREAQSGWQLQAAAELGPLTVEEHVSAAVPGRSAFTVPPQKGTPDNLSDKQLRKLEKQNSEQALSGKDMKEFSRIIKELDGAVKVSQKPAKPEKPKRRDK